jgi:hypothetical protein
MYLNHNAPVTTGINGPVQECAKALDDSSEDEAY